VKCDEARQLMGERPEARRASGASRSLARHLSQCEQCREEFAEVQRAAELLTTWSDTPVGQHQKAACLERLLAQTPTASAAHRARAERWTLAAPRRLAVAAAVASLVLLVGPMGGGVSSISAEIGEALVSIDEWRAEGTATPPLLVGPNTSLCNHVRIWFRKPNTFHLVVDAGPDGPLVSITRTGDDVVLRDPHDLLSPKLASEAAEFSVEGVFDVASWLESRSVLDAAVRDLGLSAWGSRTVRKIRIVPMSGWLADSEAAGEAGILLRVDSETMLPELLETTTHGSIVILDFEYGVPFPEEALADAA